LTKVTNTENLHQNKPKILSSYKQFKHRQNCKCVYPTNCTTSNYNKIETHIVTNRTQNILLPVTLKVV